ncbi:MAG TPA: hypothetical protein VFT12_00305 [Thermoanaerobaculia bacterium]|nr:hypothetical protein [Thermoanaerobaculia bacterium]
MRLITDRAGSSTDASAVAEAARQTQDDLTAVFAPLISSAGVAALSGRAFDLAQREYPAGKRKSDNGSADERSGEVGEWLKSQVPTEAADAAAAMFATFAELLTTLIGEALTTRYLEKVWPDGFSAAKPKGKKT